MRKGFSLPEMLLAVFILGIGIISIFALFPVGLTQQQRSQNDIIGPTVAQNAIGVIRSKLSARMVGYANVPGYTGDPILGGPNEFLRGDFTWRLPSLSFDDDPSTWEDEAGMADVFGATPGFDTPSWVPFNTDFATQRPVVVFTQAERLWPMLPRDRMVPGNTPEYDGDAEFGWDFAIRRFEGRVQVAVFVYRITNTERGRFWTTRASPAIKRMRSFAWDSGTDVIPNTDAGDPFESWQEPGSTFVDQNGETYRILVGRRSPNEGPARLANPLEPKPALPPFHYGEAADSNGMVSGDIVTDIWYVSSVPDPRGFELKPIYVGVFDL